MLETLRRLRRSRGTSASGVKGADATTAPTPLASVVDELAAALGKDAVLALADDVIVYEYDYGLDRHPPQIVVLPVNRGQVSAAVAIAARHRLPIVPRGAGTGIAGGAVPVMGGLVVGLSRLTAIRSADYDNRAALVEPGVVNLDITSAVQADGYFFAPDPSSQKASTIGGNVGNNAGGPHCLAHGVTVNHVLGLELVLADGQAVRLGGLSPDPLGYDLTGLVVGAEGTFGIVTEVTVRLMHQPEAVRTYLVVFDTIDSASEAVSDIIREGIIPAALELMDQQALVAIEAAFQAGYPPEAGAVLLAEIDGPNEAIVESEARLERICRGRGAMSFQAAADEEARARLWAGRKGAASALGRIAPNYYLHDAVVARGKLPSVLRKVIEIARSYDLLVANLFHAGDGNLHPLLVFDAREPGVLDRVLRAGREMLQACVDAGGTISGEHGIGLEKNEFMPLIFGPEDLLVMDQVRRAFDPGRLMNPGKILPSGAACAEQRMGPPATAASGLWI